MLLILHLVTLIQLALGLYLSQHRISTQQKTAALDPLTILEVLHKRRHRLRAQAWLEMDPEFRHGGKRTWSPAMAGKGPRAQSRLGFHLTLFPLSGVQSHGNGTWCQNNNMNFYTLASGPLTIFFLFLKIVIGIFFQADIRETCLLKKSLLQWPS